MSAEAEGRALAAYHQALADALVAVRDHLSSYTDLPADMKDAHGELIRSLQRGGASLDQANLELVTALETWLPNMPKILAEMGGSEHRFLTQLALARFAWWQRRQRTRG
jgi:hypothetical protein